MTASEMERMMKLQDVILKAIAKKISPSSAVARIKSLLSAQP
jgi:hypothetical protein